MTTIAERTETGAQSPRHPWLKSVRATGSWVHPKRTHVAIREFDFEIDQPLVKGGQNSAPTPMEFIAGAVNGCLTVTVESVAAELGIPVDHIETLSRAHLDVRGFTGTADVSPHYTDYALVVQIITTTSGAKLNELRRLVERRCPATNLLRDAGVPLDLQWQFSATTFPPLSDDRNRS